MRRNKMGEAYCHTAEEISSQVEMAGGGETYVIGIDHDPSSEVCKPYTAEVLGSVDGETVCHAEADGREDLVKMLERAGVEVQ